MKLKQVFLTTIISIFCAMQVMAEAIPDQFVGEGKWVTLKTANGYYFCAIKEGEEYKLAQSNKAPTSENYAAYCWQISGDATNGYSFRCLGYMNYSSGFDYSTASASESNLYITNPTTIATKDHEVLLTATNSPCTYIYTDTNHQLELKSNAGMYLAYYSQSFHTIRLHNSANYGGSQITIGGIYDWSVAAVQYGTESIGDNGIPQGTYLPGGGVVYDTKNYLHGSNITLDQESLGKLSLINDVSGYTPSTIKIDSENRYIVAYYVATGTYHQENANTTKDSETIVTGQDNYVWILDPKKYITNISGNYTSVPADRAWQIEMVVENVNKTGNDPSFNKWGSCVLASNGDPLNTYYWGDFQIYQHSSTHSSPNTLNFKSSKADGNDHIIAQGHTVENKNYKVVVRYNANGVYLIRTIMLDNTFVETGEVYNNVWVSARPQININQMSCALPTGINLKKLKISIAEECGLLEGADYAIQNVGTQHYISFGDDHTFQHYRTADHASIFQIEYTGNDDLAYHDQGGSLHATIYLIVEVWDTQSGKVVKKYIGPKDSNDVWNLVDNRTSAQPFLYSQETKMIQAITDHKATGAWAIGESNKWLFDFFATFQVDVRKNGRTVSGGDVSNFGGFIYKQQDNRHGRFVSFPASALPKAIPNISEVGYMTEIDMDATMLRANYVELENTFYNISSLNDDNGEKQATTLYYWFKNRQTAPSLITYSTKNSQSGVVEEWNKVIDANTTVNLFGDCSRYTIEKATTIPVEVSNVSDKYYGSIYCPNAMTLPNGVKAYRLASITSDGKYLLKPIEGSILAARTPAVLIGESNASGNWAVDARSSLSMGDTNLFQGVSEQTANPGSGLGTDSSIYVLGSKNDIGFYPYSGAKIPAFKAYYKLPAQQAKPVSFYFAFDEDVTGITDTTGINKEETVVYDLMGRRVTNMIKGKVYIINGEKFVK